jgi:hypothetical protein
MTNVMRPVMIISHCQASSFPGFIWRIPKLRNPEMIWAVVAMLAEGDTAQRDGCIPNPFMKTRKIISQVEQDRIKWHTPVSDADGLFLTGVEH